MSDILRRDLNDLEDTLLVLLTIVGRAKQGHLAELRRLKPHVLGGKHCGTFLFIDITSAIHDAINDAVCGCHHERVKE